MRIKKIEDKVTTLDVNGQDCHNDCKSTIWDGNRNSTDNKGRCKKKTAKNCKYTCSW